MFNYLPGLPCLIAVIFHCPFAFSGDSVQLLWLLGPFRWLGRLCLARPQLPLREPRNLVSVGRQGSSHPASCSEATSTRSLPPRALSQGSPCTVHCHTVHCPTVPLSGSAATQLSQAAPCALQPRRSGGLLPAPWTAPVLPSWRGLKVSPYPERPCW